LDFPQSPQFLHGGSAQPENLPPIRPAPAGLQRFAVLCSQLFSRFVIIGLYADSAG
jgi:hypothetical protein